MESSKLKEEVEAKISISLNESNIALATFEDKVPAFKTPKDAIAHYKEVFDKLVITGMEDKDGYNKVSKAITLCRTTRTTLENNRKEDKRFYLEAGRVVDGSYNELIELVEPIEQSLKTKKEYIDIEIEAEKQKKEDEKRIKAEARAKQLIDLKFVFNGSGYQLRDVSVLNGEIQVISDELWNQFITGAATNAYNEQVAEEKENERLKEAEAEKERISQRSLARKEKLVDVGFNHTDGMYVRPAQSEKFKAIAINVYISNDAIRHEPDAVFEQIITNAKEDEQTAKEEFKIKREAFEEEQRKTDERLREIVRKEERLAQEREQIEFDKRKAELQKIQDRTNRILALGFKLLPSNPNEAKFEIRTLIFPLTETVYADLTYWDDSVFEERLAEITEVAKVVMEKEVQLIVEDKERKEKQAKLDLEAEIKRREEQKKEFEAAERKRVEKEEKKKPEKQKLLEFAAKLEALEVPKLKELKQDAEVYRARIADIVSDIRTTHGVESQELGLK